jgi:hypothetical protein
MSFFTPKIINLYTRIGLRYMHRNRPTFIKQTFEFLNEDITKAILSFLKYEHITDDTLNSYLYIFMYELFYISVLSKMGPSHKIIEKSIIHLFLYIVFKENVFPILNDHIE